MDSRICPHCGSRVIEDAWEILTVEEDGSLTQEIIHPALVCSTFCGFYERVEESND